ncbi:MAG: iron-sulfur cluster repair di-iron protein [Bacteroidetes bacterium]|nr:iron-sulfur cluster repair di-iron protein [Bacteroidota bacterium]
MANLLEQTLAGIVTGNHQAVGVFEKYNLDFCCKGKRTLAEACLENSIDALTIERELNSIKEAQQSRQMPFTEMSAEQLINYLLVKHHFYVKQSMPRIQSHLQKVAMKHGDRFPYMREVFNLFAAVNEDMTQHMEKEEMILFPRIKEVEQLLLLNESAYIQEVFISAPIQAMETEHERAGELLFNIRRLTNNYSAPEGACTTFKICLAELKEFEEDLHEHVHLENNILFPKALKQIATSLRGQ